MLQIGALMSEFPETNLSLIKRVRELGDGASWADFMDIYQPVVFRMARRRGLQDADAHDVMQQVFVSISLSIQRWKSGEGQPPFRAWLATITRNAINKSLSRRPRDRASGSSSVLERLDEHPNPEITPEEITKESRQQTVRWAAEQIRSEFSDATWNVFWQTAIEGQAVNDVVKNSGRSAGAVYVARYRVLTRLKEKINEIPATGNYQTKSKR